MTNDNGRDTLADAIMMPTEMIPPPAALEEVVECAASAAGDEDADDHLLTPSPPSPQERRAEAAAVHDSVAPVAPPPPTPKPNVSTSQRAPEWTEPAAEVSDDAEEDDEELSEPEVELIGAAEASQGSGWTIPFLCAGLALVACCVLIPQADENRKIAYEAARLRLDLDQINTQVKVNDEFVRRIQDDPALAERLAQRQMGYVREGSAILALKGDRKGELSPFSLVSVPAAGTLPEYQPVGGKLAFLCRHARTRLYLMGCGLILVAAGLVLGFAPGGRRRFG